MIFVVFGVYFIFATYDLVNLHKRKLKKEIIIYSFLLSISLIITSLIGLDIEIPDPMIPFRKLLESIKGMLGGLL